MDDNRTYLTVILPIHPHFLPKSDTNSKEIAYRERITSALGNNTLSITELSKAMGYKGITAKLSSTVEKMIISGEIEKVIVGTHVKLCIGKNI